MNQSSIYGLTFEQLCQWLNEHGHKKYRAALVWDYLYNKRVTSFKDMHDVHHSCISLLEEHYVIQTMEKHTMQQSADGTVKFLFRLSDGNLIETVLMRQKYGLSVCVTTQVGCNIGCSFCASGLLSKSRNLLASEIVEQILSVQHHLDQANNNEKVSHVVVMGIGEPLDNFEHLVTFLQIIKDQKGMAIGARHITVSTSGLADQIKKFADLKLQVNLAVSLHAPNNELRSRIMKINRAIPIESLMEAIDYYLTTTKRRITLAYILLKDVNDHREHAVQLAELIADKRHLVKVNLIPYNPVDELSEYKRSDQASVLAFYDTLKKHDINCTVRLEHGTDIDAACGQLRSKQLKEDMLV